MNLPPPTIEQPVSIKEQNDQEEDSQIVRLIMNILKIPSKKKVLFEVTDLSMQYKKTSGIVNKIAVLLNLNANQNNWPFIESILDKKIQSN